MKINPTLSRDAVYPQKRFLWGTAKKIIMTIKLVFESKSLMVGCCCQISILTVFCIDPYFSFVLSSSCLPLGFFTFFET